MLVCHCNVISQADIERVIVEMLDEDPYELIVPARVFRALAKRGQCCGCIPNMSETIVKVVKAYHADLDSADRDVAALMERLMSFHSRQEDKQNARRTRSHRKAQRSSVS